MRQDLAIAGMQRACVRRTQRGSRGAHGAGDHRAVFVPDSGAAEEHTANDHPVMPTRSPRQLAHRQLTKRTAERATQLITIQQSCVGEQCQQFEPGWRGWRHRDTGQQPTYSSAPRQTTTDNRFRDSCLGTAAHRTIDHVYVVVFCLTGFSFVSHFTVRQAPDDSPRPERN
jgi:hypothetical protein